LISRKQNTHRTDREKTLREIETARETHRERERYERDRRNRQ